MYSTLLQTDWDTNVSQQGVASCMTWHYPKPTPPPPRAWVQTTQTTQPEPRGWVQTTQSTQPAIVETQTTENPEGTLVETTTKTTVSFTRVQILCRRDLLINLS